MPHPGPSGPSSLPVDPRRDHPLARVDLNLLVAFDVLMRERSVARAAIVLHRTASAVSHALGRLRASMQDPLLVRLGGAMVPTPRAERLWGEIQPLLGSLGQVLQAGDGFDPCRTHRTFRVALPPFTSALFARLWHRVQAQAPGVCLLVGKYDDTTLQAVHGGSIDLAIVPEQDMLPESVHSDTLAVVPWACALREGHPALDDWTRATWERLPHVGTDIGRVVRPLQKVLAAQDIRLHMPYIVPTMLAMADVLESTDLVATNARPVLRALAHGRRVRLMEPPVPIPPLAVALCRNRRWSGEPGLAWLSGVLADVVREEIAAWS